MGRTGDTVFAVFHLLALVAVLGYGLAMLIAGETGRGALVLGALAVYYVLVLHPAVRKEIARKRRKK